MSKLKVLFVASEGVPFIKTGGLADVVGSLPQELKKSEIDVRVVMPFYKGIRNRNLELEYCGAHDVWVSWRQKEAKILLHKSEVDTYFIENNEYFDRDGLYGYEDDDERYAFFCKAVLDMLPNIDFIPDIIHCNDWQSGPICMYLKEKYSKNKIYKDMKSVFTIHNIKYQGVFPKKTLDVLGLDDEYFNLDSIECCNMVNYMKTGITYSDIITTVSPTYAGEIQQPENGYGLDGILRKRQNDLYGILNGIDENEYNPEKDKCLDVNYSLDTLDLKGENKRQLQKSFGLNQEDAMVISIVTRLVEQKGLDLFKSNVYDTWILDKILEHNIQLVILGTGDSEYENMFRHLEYKYPGRVKSNIMFSEDLSRKIYASSDVYLMPSLFEPCGLGQLIAMKYGSVPIVRKVGGLKDTVVHYNQEDKTGTGFEFKEYNGYWLYSKIMESYNLYINQKDDFIQIQKNGMSSNFSWEKSANRYKDLYQKLIN